MSTRRRLRWVLFAVWLAVAESAAAAVCDVDDDGDVDRLDVQAVAAARGTPALPGDPADADGDGLITVGDARACVLRCDLPRCAIVTSNATPIADAGPDQQAVPGDVVQLDGSGSTDADGDLLTYAWSLISKPASSQTVLQDSASVAPRLTPDQSGTYVAELTVNDGVNSSAPATVVIDVPVPVLEFDFTEQRIATLTPEGGTVRFDDPAGSSYVLEVPSDAIAVPTEFRMTRVESIAGLPRGFTPIAAVRLEPEGFDFRGAASLTIELDSSARSGEFAVGFLIDDSGQNLVFVPLQGTDPMTAARSDLLVTINVPHFTGAGVMEAGGDAFFPPPPPAPGPGADAQAIALYKLAQRLWELDILNGGVLEPDDFVAVAALNEWLADIQSRASVLAIAPDTTDLGSLRDLNAEMISFWTEALNYLSSTSQQALVSEVVNTLSNVVASYLADLLLDCANDTADAQIKLNTLRVDIVGSFPLSELADAFVNEAFSCRYDITFTPDFKAAFFGEFVGFDYQITAEDGSDVTGGFQSLGPDFDTQTTNLTIESITAERVIVRTEFLGLGTLTVKIGDGPESTAEVLSIPSFVGSYGVTYSGSAGNCSDPDDAGSGSGALGLSIDTEQILTGNRTSASVGVAGGGGIVTGLTMTLNLVNFAADSASGSVSFGSADYRVVEVEDGITYVTVGSGSLTGSVVGTLTGGNTFGLDFNGGDNFCSTVQGTITMLSP